MPNIGNTATPSDAFSFSGINSDNEFGIPLTMASTGGLITSVSGYLAGHGGSANVVAAIWNSSGVALAQSAYGPTIPAGTGGRGGQGWHTFSLSYVASPNQSLIVGFWRAPSQQWEWTENSGGTEYFATNTSGNIGNILTDSGHYTSTGSPGFYFTYTPPPAISGINPTAGQVGSLVQITGSGFNSSQGGGYVTFGGYTALISSWSDTSIWCYVPTNFTTTQTVNVQVAQNSQVSNAASFTVQVGGVKIWNGSTWGKYKVKVWNGTAWVWRPVRAWDGSNWIRRG